METFFRLRLHTPLGCFGALCAGLLRLEVATTHDLVGVAKSFASEVKTDSGAVDVRGRCLDGRVARRPGCRHVTVAQNSSMRSQISGSYTDSCVMMGPSGPSACLFEFACAKMFATISYRLGS